MSRTFESFHIKQFRGLRDVTLTGLADVNVLLGLNNSGKTSVLEALALYCAPFAEEDWWGLVQKRGERGQSGKTFDAIEWLFPHSGENDNLQPIELGASGGRLGRITVDAARETKLEQDHEIDNEGKFVVIGEHQERILTVRVHFPGIGKDRKLEFSEAGVWPRSQHADSLETPFKYLTPVSARIDRAELEAFSKTSLEGAESTVVEMLRMIDARVQDLKILTPVGTYPVLHVEYEGLGVVPTSILGDGVRRAASIAFAVSSLRDGLLLIDEIENAIHVKALEAVFPWLVRTCRTNNVQLFATTHSLEAIDALLTATRKSGDGFVCHQLRRRDDKTFVQRFDSELMYDMRYEGGLDVRLAR